jgi:hypothetical protein
MLGVSFEPEEEAPMTEEHIEARYAEVRRSDRAVDDDAWIAAFLRAAPMAQLATVDGGQPFINSNLFVFDEAQRAIYMHTAGAGRTRANVDGDERVCFSASEMGRLLPAPRMFNLSVEYAGVVVFGRARAVQGDAEKLLALRMLVDKYFPHLRAGDDYQLPSQAELNATSVYRIEIEAWSGKRKVVEDDFPGAFTFKPPA